MASIGRFSGSRNLATRSAIAFGSGVVLGMNPQPGFATPCPVDAPIALMRDGEWRCDVDLQTGLPYRLTMTQDHADLSIRVVDTAGRSVLEVDSPTHRAGPEILLIRPEQGGTFSVVVRTVDRGPHKIQSEVELDRLAADVDRALIQGLSLLTQAARPSSQGQDANVDDRLRALDESAKRFAAVGDDVLETEAHWRMAALRYWRGDDWERAAALASEAARRFDEIGDSVGRAHADTMRGAALIETGNAAPTASRARGARSRSSPFDEAESLLKNAADTFQRNGLVYFEAETINHLGIVYFYEGRYPEARARWSQAVELFDAAEEDSVLPLQNLAVLDFSRGDYDRAIESYERLLERLDSRSDLSTRIAILDNLGVACHVTGRTDRALKAYLQALDLTPSLPDPPRLRYQTLHDLGVLYQTIGDEERAAVLLEQALELRRTPTAGDPRGLLTSLLRVGELHRERGETDEAIRLHLEAMEHAGSSTDRGRALLAIAEDQLAAGHRELALEAAKSAHAIGLPRDWPLARSIESTRAYARILVGERDGVTALLAAAAANLEAGNADVAARDFHRLALHSYRQGQLDDSLAYAERAIGIYERQRLFALNPDLRATYLAVRATTYDLQTEILLTKADRADDAGARDQWMERAVKAAERRRLRALAEFSFYAAADRAGEAFEILELDRRLAAKRHRLASLQERSEPPADQIESLQRDLQLLRARLDVAVGESTADTVSKTTNDDGVSLARLRQHLDGQEVLLTNLAGIEHHWLLVLTREATSLRMIGTRGEVETSAGHLQRVWSQHSTDLDPQSELESSRRILGASTDYLRGKSRVVVVPDDVLRRLPFGALRVSAEGENAQGRRLIEDHRVSYRASLSRFDRQWPKNGAPQQRILLVGAPDFAPRASDPSDEIAFEEFAPLPGARRELEDIAVRARDWHVDLLVGERATKANLRQMPIADYRVLHFATHARLDVQDPQLSAIALTSRSSSGLVDDPMLNLREVLSLDLRAEAVVLSTCDSSLGKRYRAQATLGLSEAFLMAGAGEVLGSLWRVPDTATRAYMDALYSAYLGKHPALADAVYVAARTMMATPRFRHPYYWAAFVTQSR